MRISTANAYDAGIDSLVRRQGELAGMQDKMTSGKRVAKASDDPAAAARAERALASISRTETSQRAVEASKVVMTQTESALGAAGVTAATIDSGRVSDPSALTGADYTLQFSVGGGVTTYAVLQNGLPTAVTAAPYVSGQAIVVDGMTFAVSGTPANGDQFQVAPSTPSLSVFGMLDRAIVGLQTAGRTGSQIAQATSENLRDIDAVMGTLQTARAAAGEVLNRIESETGRLDDLKLASQTERSNAEDVDMVHAISEFQNKQSGYDAALKSYAMVQRLSLFQYVNG